MAQPPFSVMQVFTQAKDACYMPFTYNIYDMRETLNPLCAINDGVEDTEHYFLLCHAYDVFRNDLLNSVNAILLPSGIKCPSNEELLKVILYGHEQLSFDSNSQSSTGIYPHFQTF